MHYLVYYNCVSETFKGNRKKKTLKECQVEEMEHPNLPFLKAMHSVN